MMKHAFTGKSPPHLRYVWCSDDLTTVYWGDIKGDINKLKNVRKAKSMPVEELQVRLRVCAAMATSCVCGHGDFVCVWP